MSTHPFESGGSGDWLLEPCPSEALPERRDPEMDYWVLRCPCETNEFRASGWPTSANGPGGHFWRTVARVWREARQATQEGEPVDSPFELPLMLQCASCGREGEIQLSRRGGVPTCPRAESGADSSLEPREAYRCRVCRRAVVTILLGGARRIVQDPSLQDGDQRLAADIVARCRACRREARIAWYDDRPSSQEVRLDFLYGRR